jgi:hypothetical protein
MSNRALAGAFDRWAEMAQEAKEMRILIQRCMKKMMNRQLNGRGSSTSHLNLS